MTILPINKSISNNTWDKLRINKAGMIALEGWSAAERIEHLPNLLINGQKINALEHFRVERMDVAQALGSDNTFTGVQVNYLLRDFENQSRTIKITLRQDDKIFYQKRIGFDFQPAHYAGLFETAQVMHREHIYATGPPSPQNAPEVLRLIERLNGNILDFGCGSGFLVKTLREKGMSAYGVEMDYEKIRKALHPSVRPFVKLYNGELPLPFADGQFDSVIATEVLEHIPNYREVLSEIRRVTSDQLLLTVPDMSGIPLGFHNNVVPWHLLESTHVNFFTQSSLYHTLKDFFSDISFSRIGVLETNGTRWYTSLVAICKV